MSDKNIPVTKGPIRDRKCTDCCCLIIFLSFVGLMAFISIFAYSNGNLKNVAKVIDSDQKPCGEAERTEYPYVYINDPYTTSFFKNTICLRKCPSQDTDTVECYPNEDIKKCSDIKVRASVTIFSRLCIPKVKSMANAVKKTINLSYIQESLEDIKEVWPMFFVAFIIGIVILAFYLCIIRVCTKCFVFTMLILVLAGLILLGVFCWKEYKEILNINADIEKVEAGPSSKDPNDPDTDIEEEESTEYGKEQAKKWKIAAIVLWVAAGLFFLAILLLCGRITLAADILSSAAEFVQKKSSVFIIPVFYICMLLLLLIWWIPTFAMLTSCGETSPDEKSVFMNIAWSNKIYAYLFIFAFGLMWFVFFNFSQETFSIAALTSSWYFERHNHTEINALTGIGWSFSYHIGTLAFGSFLIALLWLIQLILQYIYQRLKQTGAQNTQLGFIVRCAQCFVACFERTIKFINKHAYIETALRNLNFCAAAMKCLEVTSSNFLRFGVLSGLLELFLFLGDLFISCSTTFIMYFVIKAYAKAKDLEVDTLAPHLLIFFVVLSMCIIFSYVYEISADTLLHCYILDEEDGIVDGFKGGKCPGKLKETIENQINPI